MRSAVESSSAFGSPSRPRPRELSLSRTGGRGTMVTTWKGLARVGADNSARCLLSFYATTSTHAMDTSDDVQKFASLERRVADLEARSQSPQTWREWLRSFLRWLATTPPLLLVLLVGIDRLSSATALPLGFLLIVLWASAAVLWAAVEVLAGGDLRFRVTRLILLVAIVAACMGYWQVAVHQPYAAEQSCLASLKGAQPGRRQGTDRAGLAD
jgi:hypothetical protein